MKFIVEESLALLAFTVLTGYLITNAAVLS